MGQVRWLGAAFIAILVASFAFLLSSAGRTAHQPERATVHVVTPSQSLPPLIAEYHGVIANSAKPAEKLPSGDSGGIREQVPEEYAARYQHWKQEFLASETGRQQWASIKTIRTSR
jgi:hypothetical protein